MLLLAAACSDDTESGGTAADVTFAQVDLTHHPLLYTAGDDDTLDLWVTTVDGHDPKRLTTSPGPEAFATWSPDGTQIAFGAASTDEPTGDLYVANADGAGLKRVTDTAADESWPVWSPDGTQLLYTETEPDVEFGTVKTIGVDGTAEHALAEHAGWGDWSPDGTQIVYAETDTGDEGQIHIRVMDADGDNKKTISPESLVAPNEPTWSPDGRQIALSASFGDPNSESEDPADWDYDLLVMDADGTNVRKVADLEGNEHYPPAWSPDGRHLAFTADGQELEAELMSVDLQSGRVTQLTDNGTHDLAPDWRDTTPPTS